MAAGDSSRERERKKKAERGVAPIEKIEKSRAHSLLSLPYAHAGNRPSNREGIIDKVDGVRMHVSLSEAVSKFITEEDGEREN